MQRTILRREVTGVDVCNETGDNILGADATDNSLIMLAMQSQAGQSGSRQRKRQTTWQEVQDSPV